MIDELESLCVVCHRPLEMDPATLGERTYCEAHIERVAQDRPSLWQAITAQLVVLPIMLVAVLIGSQTLGIRPTGNLRVPVSMALAVLPGVSFLVALAVQELVTGEATRFLATVVVSGALVASALGLPFLEQVADINSWLPNGSLTVRFLGNILLVGSTHMFLIYGVVRYTVMRTTAFERRVDGIFFAVATAVGYATMLNIQLAVKSGGFDPASGMFRVTGDVVGHAGAAAVLGFFMGRHRLESLPPWTLPAGLMLAAAIDGIMVYSRAEINRTSVGLTRDAFSPWPGLIFSFVLAGISFVVIYGLLRRINALTQAQMQTTS